MASFIDANSSPAQPCHSAASWRLPRRRAHLGTSERHCSRGRPRRASSDQATQQRGRSAQSWLAVRRPGGGDVVWLRPCKNYQRSCVYAQVLIPRFGLKNMGCMAYRRRAKRGARAAGGFRRSPRASFLRRCARGPPVALSEAARKRSGKVAPAPGQVRLAGAGATARIEGS